MFFVLFHHTTEIIDEKLRTKSNATALLAVLSNRIGWTVLNYDSFTDGN